MKLRLLLYLIIFSVLPSTSYGLESKLGRFQYLANESNPKVGSSTVWGKPISSYPTELLGNWGGELEITSYRSTDLFSKVDSRLAGKSIEHLKLGRKCRINLTFKSDHEGKLQLLPVKGTIMIPANTSDVAQLTLSTGEYTPGERAAIQEALNRNMLPLTFYVGPFNAMGKERLGPSNNQTQAILIFSTDKKLTKDIFEKQIVCENLNRNFETTRKGIEESVIQMEILNKHELSVNIVALNGTKDGRMLDKLLLSGILTKGIREETNAKVIFEKTFKP